MSERKTGDIPSIRSREHADQRRRHSALMSLSGYLEDSALVGTREFSGRDVDLVRGLILQAAPFFHPKVNAHFPEHLLSAAIYSRMLASQVRDSGLNLYEAETIGGYFHDGGRIEVPHRRVRPDLVGIVLLSGWGIIPQYTDKSPSIPQILGIVPGVSGLPDMSVPQRIYDVADNLGKRNPDGSFFTVKQMEGYVNTLSQRYPDLVWPSEMAGEDARNERPGFSMQLVLEEIRWLAKERGVNFDQLRGEMEQEYFRRENQNWILGVKNGQESLDLRVDRLLERPQVKHLVFDIGGVLFEDGDKRLFKSIAGKLGIEEVRVEEAIQASLDKGMAGQLLGENYLRRVFQDMGVAFPGYEKGIEIFSCPEVYRPVEGMQRVVSQLSRRGVEIWLLSDALPALVEIIKRQVGVYYPEIDQKKILISSEQGVSKKQQGHPAFSHLLNTLGISEGQEEQVVFVDDKENYAFGARNRYGIRGFTFIGDPLESLTAVERLERELKKGALIS